jgi:phenylacetate-CoA ligase
LNVRRKTDEAGYGELVYTTLRRCVMPLIRYRSGDVTRIITDPCSCGVPSLRLAKLKGRADEMVVTGVGNIAPWMVEDVMSRMSPMILEWQLCVQHEGTRDLLECRVENSQKLSDKDLRTKLMNAMQSGMPVARQGIMNGLAAFKVRSYETGTLRKGRKIKRILDQRNYTNDKPPSAKRV